MENARIITGGFDGSCEPINPMGIATYGFAVFSSLGPLHAGRGLAAAPFTPEATNNVAEYVGLIKLLEWLAQNGYTTAPVRLHGDSKLVIFQVLGKWKVGTDHLRPFHRIAQDYLGLFDNIQITWVPREANREADEQTHLAYVEFLDANPQARAKLPLATEAHLSALRDHGIETYPYMGVREANRLLERRLRALEVARSEH